LQAIVNLIDHGMSLQEAVEAPRVWTEGGVLELEEARSRTAWRRRTRSRAATRWCASPRDRRRHERHRLQFRTAP
jgi:gamma-glutamyltranspeptidase